MVTSAEKRLAKRRERWALAFELVERGEARPQVVEAVELVKRGCDPAEVGERLGIARSTVYQRLGDPTDEQNRARKARQNGTCEDCGGATSYGTKGDLPTRCIRCARTVHEERNERIFAAWEHGEKAPEIAAREEMSAGAVTSIVDTHRRGGRDISLHRERDRHLWDEIAPLWRGGLTAREIGERFGLTARDVTARIKNMRTAGLNLPAHEHPAPWRAPEQIKRLELLWAEGLTLAEINRLMGWGDNSGSVITRLRRAGYDFPYRRSDKVAAAA